ncbi:MAG TPA: hypothetical protein VMY05_02770 [Acidobacteriota bacterium]|nr:hypothetical protein [Acidobacteriota bacterium]
MKKRTILLVVLILAVAAIGAVSYRTYQRNYHLWLWDYTFNSPTRADTDGLTDIIFVVVDHWEPGGDLDIVNTWMQDYRKLADGHVDADGVRLQHTFFYPLESFRGWEVDSLVRLCGEGYGEVEVHLHHRNDDSSSVRRLFRDGIDSLRAHGALRTPDGSTYFGFIHGNWALDNSRSDGNFCGVNNEIDILLDLGCYADFTFPALTQTAQPSLVNKIYYAADDPEKPKSHNTGARSRVGRADTEGGLMIMEGPQVINWSDWRFKTHPVIDDGNLYPDVPTSFERFELWLRADVHVQGRPNWVFIRPFTHGAYLRDGAFDDILGERLDGMLTQVEERYNDGIKYRLHYMTAREAYNVVKAAEAGYDGNPDEFRDFVLKPYLYEQETLDRRDRDGVQKK